MLTMIVTPPGGEPTTISAEEGLSVMEIIRDAGFEALPALCGGCCSCATCHVYIDTAFADRLAPIGEDEDLLLDGSDHRLPTSRLACQVAYGAALDGMKVRIAPTD